MAGAADSPNPAEVKVRRPVYRSYGEIIRMLIGAAETV